MSSGLSLIADIAQYSRHVSKVPTPTRDSCTAANRTSLARRPRRGWQVHDLMLPMYREFESRLVRQLVEGRVFSRRSSWQLSPVAVAISRLRFGLPIGRAGLLFSERPVSLRSSGPRRFGTVLEIRTFRVAYEPQRKEVLRLLSDGRGRPISNSPSRGLNPATPAKQSGAERKCP